MARAPCLLAAAVAVAYSLPTAAAQNTLDAQVFGVGADYFAAGIHAFKCELVPSVAATASTLRAPMSKPTNLAAAT